MRNTGIVLFLVGAYIVINAGSFRDLIMGKARLNFNSPTSGGRGSGGSWDNDDNDGGSAGKKRA